MPIPLNEHVIVTIGPELGNSGGGGELPPSPGPPGDALTPNFWDGSGYTWTNDVEWRWSAHTSASLLAAGKGENANWEVGFRPTSMDITVNAGPDIGGFGFLFGQDIYVRDVSDNILGAVAFDFDFYSQEKSFTIPLTFGTEDIARIHVESFLYNEGPIIQVIHFNA